jgi:hypothetical protein
METLRNKVPKVDPCGASDFIEHNDEKLPIRAEDCWSNSVIQSTYTEKILKLRSFQE